MTEPDPAVTARRDQAAAADQHAREIIRMAAEAADAHKDTGPPGPVEWVIIRRMIATAKRKEITVCPHISPAAPQPEFWQAWDPRRVRCQDCALAAWQAILGTELAETCDNCSTVTEQITDRVTQMPPVAAQAPVVISFRLCPACQAANQNTTG